MFDALLRMQLSPIIERLAEMEAEIDDLHRRAESFCRIGVCVSVDAPSNTCKVSHGDLLTPAIRFFNPSAGEQSESRIPSVGEQCLLLNYGAGEGGSQSVALFGINCDRFPPVATTVNLTRRLHKDGTESRYDDSAHVLDWKNGGTAFRGSREVVELTLGPARLALTPQSIELKLGAVGLTLDAAGVHLLGPLVDHQGRIISTA